MTVLLSGSSGLVGRAVADELSNAGHAVKRLVRREAVSSDEISWDPAEGLIDAFRKVVKTGEPMHHPISFYNDGKISGWYENFIYKLSSGEIVAVFENLTTEKQAQEELKLLNLDLEQRVAERTERLRQSESLLRETERMSRVGGWNLILKQKTPYGHRKSITSTSYRPRLNRT